MYKAVRQWPNGDSENRGVDLSFRPVPKAQDSFYSLQNMQNREMKEFIP